MKDISAKQAVEIRINDLSELAKKKGRPLFTSFLNEQEQFFAQKLLTARGDVYFRFFGGAEVCTRKMLLVSAYEEEEEFPIYPLSFSFRKIDKPEHRDFLGAFMGLGLKREMIGDIFVEEGYAAAFCTKTARDLILDCITAVGRTGVSVSEGLLRPVPGQKFEDVSLIVASMRADCLVSGITGLSREKSADFIRSGYFLLNYSECQNVSKNISQGDILTLRGYGKFIVSEEAVQTKKGRLRIILKKYS